MPIMTRMRDSMPIILFGLLIFANGNDIIKLFR